MTDSHLEIHEVDEILEQAKQLHRKGKRDEANLVYVQVLHQFPENVEALRLRAVVCLEQGDTENTEMLLKNAIRLDPDNAQIHNNFGSLYHNQKKYHLAVRHFDKALELDKGFSHAASNLGNALQALGETQRAIRAYEKALEIEPRLAPAWNNLGTLLNKLNRTDDAEKLFHKALSINPKYKDAWNNLGICYDNKGRTIQALKAYEKALELDSNYSLALNNKGNLLLRQNRSEEALVCFEAATKANRNVAEAWNGCGYAHKNLGQLQQAVNCFKKSIALNREYAEAWNNLGLTYADQGLLDDALDAFRTALKICPTYVACHSNLLLFLNYLPGLHEKTLFEAHVNWAATHQKYAEGNQFTRRTDFSRPIHIGFVSADFCRHPISYFLLPVLRNLSADKFRIFCYSNSVLEDDLTMMVKKYCHAWRSIVDQSDQELAQSIRQDRIDVLFDLSGHTSRHRLTAFSLQPAPLQLSWLGYPHTTGLESIDYVLSDSICLPDFLHWQYSEKVAFLPNSRCCYEAPLYAPAINDLPALKNGFITFGSFNNPVKINEKSIAMWSDILHRCNKSVLALSWKTLSDASIADSILNRFENHSIESERIKMLGGTRKHKQVFSDYLQIDIALDTYPFSGGLTSCEAMWMGVPVVSLAGKRPASRQSASMLAEIELDELVNFSPSDYCDCAVNLANNTKKLANIRKSLRSRMLNSTLCDEERFTFDFEKTVTELFLKKQKELSNPVQSE